MKSPIRITCLALAALLAACGSDARPLKVSARTLPPSETVAPNETPAPAVEGPLDLGNGFVLEEILLAVRKVEVRDGDGEHAYGPYGVAIAGAACGSGAVTPQFEVMLEVGDYDGLQILIDTVPATHVGDDAILKELDAVHASFLVRGTWQGAPFEFHGPLALVQNRGAFEVGDAAVKATLEVDPLGWFDDGQGGLLDPTDDALRDEILANVRASIKLAR